MKNYNYLIQLTSVTTRWIFTSVIMLTVLSLTTTNVLGQASMANIGFATNNTGSLEDLTSGSTQYLPVAVADDAGGAVTALGFDFYFMGVRYTHFSANSNGQLRLHTSAGATAISGTNVSSLSALTVTIAPFAGDNQVVSGMRIKTFGSAPNRKLVVEWTQFTVRYDFPLSNAGNMQLWLEESTGIISCVYGEMYNADDASAIRGIFLASSNTATTARSIRIGNPCVAVDSAGVVDNTIAAGSGTTTGSPLVANIGSSSNSARTNFVFTPTVTPADPSGLNFTAVGPFGMTLKWTDVSGELGYAVYRSDDGGTTYNFAAQVATNLDSAIITGLTPGTNYFWRVYSIAEGRLSTNAASGNQATNPAGNISSNGTGGGLWTSPATWTGGVVPINSDNVTIAAGDVVTQDSTNAQAYSLTVNGTLTYLATAARTLTVGTNVTINASGTINSAATGTVTTHSLVVNGNLTNDGILDLSTNTNTAGVALTFTGATNNTFSGTGTTTDLRTLIINKGTSNANILELSTSVFTLQGTISDGTPMAFLTLTNGTLKVSGSFSINSRFFSGLPAYTIGATAGFWLNNSNITVSGQNASPTLTGLLRITAGTYNIGTGTGNSMGFSSGSRIIIEGGAVNSTGRFGVASSFNSITYNQSGGTVTVATSGHSSTTLASFDLGSTSASSSITWSGGTVILQNASTAASGPRDFRGNVSATVPTFTGGTLQVGSATTATNFTFRIQGYTPHLVINNTTNNKIAQTVATTNILGNVTINTGTSYDANAFTTFFRGTTLTNNGAILGAAASSRLDFRGSAAQTYSGTGTFGTLAAPFQGTAGNGGLGLNNAAGATLSSPIITSRVNLFTGSFVNSNQISIGGGGAINCAIQRGGVATSAAGSFDVAPTFNMGTGGLFHIYSPALVGVATSNEIPGSRSDSALIIDNSNGVTLTGGALSSGTLTLTSGLLYTTSANLLTVRGTTTGSVSGASATSYVNGPIARRLPASLLTGSTYSFPTGKGTFRPFELVNPTTNAGGTVVAQAEVFDANSGGSGAGLINSINSNRYWEASITSGGGNFTNTLIRLNDTTGLAGGTADAVAESATLGGGYTLSGGTATTVTATSVTSTAPGSTSLVGFYALGLRATPTLSGLAPSPVGNSCTSSARTITITVTPGGSVVDSVVIIYSVVGGASNVRVSMAQAPANFWTGVIPIPTPATGLVTWSVTAYDMAGFVKTQNGASYKDGTPNPGEQITITPATPSFCGAGGNTLLVASSTIGYSYTWTSLDPSATLNDLGSGVADFTVTQTSDARAVGVSGLCVDSGFISIGVYSFPVSTPSPATANLCLGDSITLNSGLSASNFAAACIPYAPLTPPANASVLNNTVTLGGGSFDDGGWPNLPLGFTFNYFGKNYTTVAAGTNGMLMFGTVPSYGTGSGGLGTFNFSGPPAGFPSSANPGNVIAVLACDMNFTSGVGTIKYWTTGNIPNRKFVIQYINVPTFSGPGSVTAEAILSETIGTVEIHVTKATRQAADNSGRKYIGLQDSTKTIGATAPNCLTSVANYWNGVIDSIGSAAPFAWLFTPPHNYTVTWTSTPAGQFGSGATSGTNVFSVTAKPTALGTKDYKIFFTDQVTQCNNLNNEPHVFITALSVPVAGVITPDTVKVCGSQTVALSISNAGSLATTDTVKWYLDLNGSPVATGNTYSPLVTDTVMYYIKTGNGTCFAAGIDSVRIELTGATPIVASNSGAICPGPGYCGTVQVNSTNPNYTYSWSPPALSGPGPHAICPAGLPTPETYLIVTAVDNNPLSPDFGCMAIDSTRFSYLTPPPINSLTATPASVCSDSSSVLTAVAPFNFIEKYTFAQSTSTFTSISGNPGAIRLKDTTDASTDDDNFGPFPIEFPFTFNNAVFDTFGINANGWIQLGKAAINSAAPLTNTALTNVIAGFTEDLEGDTSVSPNAKLLYEVSGLAGSRVLTIEWAHWGFWLNALNDEFNFQIKLYESTNQVKFVYGPNAGGVTSSQTMDVGIKGSSNADFNCRTTSTDWSATTAGATSSANCTYSATVRPADGLTFTYTPSLATGNTLTWSVISGTGGLSSTSSNPTTGINITSTTDYKLIVSDGICSSTDTVTVTAVPLSAVITKTGPAQPVCPNSLLTFSAAPSGGGSPYLYVWTGAGLITTTGASVTARPLVTTTYHVFITDNCNTTIDSSFTIAVLTNPLSASTSQATVCGYPHTVTLTASGGVDPYTWSPATGLDTVGGAVVQATPFDTTTYTVTSTIAGCAYTKAVTVNVKPAPDFTIIRSDSVICGSGTLASIIQLDYSYAGYSASSFVWTESITGVLDVLTGDYLNASTTATVQLSVTATEIGGDECILTKGTSLDVFSFQAFNATTGRDTVCFGDTTRLTTGVTATNFVAGTIAYNPQVFTTPTVLCDAGVALVPRDLGFSLDDGGWDSIPIGFAFKYFGVNYTQLKVACNGNLQFASTFSTSFTPGAIPAVSTPNDFIAACWSDLLFSVSGKIQYQTKGFAPGRIFVIEWDGPSFGNTSAHTKVQALLYETTGIVEVHLLESNGVASTGGGVKTIGVENIDGTIGAAIAGRNGTNWSTTSAAPEAYRFSPPVSYSFAWTSDPIGFTSSAGDTIANPFGTVKYYVQVTDDYTLCLANDSVTVTALDSITAPVTVSDSLCGPGIVTVTASGADSLFWFTTATGNVRVGVPGNGTSYSPNLTATATYYVESNDGVCGSERTPVVAKINAIPTFIVSAGSITGCAPLTTNLVAGSVTANAHYAVSNIPYSPVLPSGSPTVLTHDSIFDVPLSSGSLDDGVWSAISLPFTFNLYGTNYTSISVSTNGFITFGASATNTTAGYGNPFPSTSAGRPSVGAVYGDLDFRSSDSTTWGIAYYTEGSAPNRKFVVSWLNGRFWNGTLSSVGSVSTQIVLNEATWTVEVHTQLVDHNVNASLAVQGIQNSAGTVADVVTGRNGTAFNASEDAYLFTPQITASGAVYSFAWTGDNLTNSNTATPTVNGISAGAHVYTAIGYTASGCFSTRSITITPFNCAATVNVKALIQGFYIGGGKMTPTMFNEQMPGATEAMVDTVTIELHDKDDYTILVDQYKAIIDTGGKVTGFMNVASVGNYYYLTFRHRNSNLTTSAHPVLLQSVTDYDFRLRSDSAFGDPYLFGFPYEEQYNFNDGFVGIYSGDVNQDEYIATDDVTNVDNDNIFFPPFEPTPGGYWLSDINGDGYVDTGDVTPTDNNNLAAVFSQHP